MHRVPLHTGACRAYHGHRYVAEITCKGSVKEDGMIIDFGIIKSLLGDWIDNNWDHTAILQRSDSDPAIRYIQESNEKYGKPVYFMDLAPTSENIAIELFTVASRLFKDEPIEVSRIDIHETPNCYASFQPGQPAS